MMGKIVEQNPAERLIGYLLKKASERAVNEVERLAMEVLSLNTGYVTQFTMGHRTYFFNRKTGHENKIQYPKTLLGFDRLQAFIKKYDKILDLTRHEVQVDWNNGQFVSMITWNFD